MSTSFLDVQLCTRFGTFNLVTDCYTKTEPMFAFMCCVEHAIWGGCGIVSVVLVSGVRVDVSEPFMGFRARVTSGTELGIALAGFLADVDQAIARAMESVVATPRSAQTQHQGGFQ